MTITSDSFNQWFTTDQPTRRCVVLGTVVSDTRIKVAREALVPGATVICDDPRWSLGGNAGRCAATLAALGAEVVLIGEVGNDIPGQRIVERLRRISVDTVGVVIHDGHATSSTTSLVDADGERTLIHNYGANACMNAAVMDRLKAVLRPGDILAICGARLLPGLSLTDVAGLFEYAGGVGAMTVYDTTKRPTASSEDLGPVLSGADVFCTSMGEAEEDWGLSGASDVAEHLRTICRQSVVVKAGQAGAWFAEKQAAPGRCIAPRVEAVDTTGAGDNFMAGLLYGLSCGAALADAVSMGVAVGALSVSRPGDICDGMDRERLRELVGAVARVAVE